MFQDSISDHPIDGCTFMFLVGWLPLGGHGDCRVDVRVPIGGVVMAIVGLTSVAYWVVVRVLHWVVMDIVWWTFVCLLGGCSCSSLSGHGDRRVDDRVTI